MFHQTLVKSIKWSYKKLDSNDYDGLKMIFTSKSGFFERGGVMLKGNLPDSFVDSSFSFPLILTRFEITLKKRIINAPVSTGLFSSLSD